MTAITLSNKERAFLLSAVVDNKSTTECLRTKLRYNWILEKNMLFSSDIYLFTALPVNTNNKSEGAVFVPFNKTSNTFVADSIAADNMISAPKFCTHVIDYMKENSATIELPQNVSYTRKEQRNYCVLYEKSSNNKLSIVDYVLNSKRYDLCAFNLRHLVVIARYFNAQSTMWYNNGPSGRPSSFIFLNENTGWTSGLTCLPTVK